MWNQAIEAAAAQLLGLTGDDARKFSGRGKPHFKVWQHNGVQLIVHVDDKTYVSTHAREKSRVQLQLGRIQQWTARSKTAVARARPHNSVFNQQALRLILGDANSADKVGGDLLDVFRAGMPSPLQLGIYLRLLDKHYTKVIHTLRGIVKQEKHEQKVTAQAAVRKEHLRSTHRAIRGWGTACATSLRQADWGWASRATNWEHCYSA